MNQAETNILRQFRYYSIRPAEMLFFNSQSAKAHPQQFTQAMQSLVNRGMVVRERPRNAYSLTDLGYQASLSV